MTITCRWCKHIVILLVKKERREEKTLCLSVCVSLIDAEKKVAVLAGLKRIVVTQNRTRKSKSKSKSKKKKKTVVCKQKLKSKLKLKLKLMRNIWQTMIFPVRRLCLAISTRINHRKNGAGLLKLQDDVQTCEYEDVQVMWEMLHKNETQVTEHNHHKRKQLPFWRVFGMLQPSQSSNHS
uniref:Uncharacterized protein LOC101489986 n=1 Tax=Cicer arietinum TaxID=3827 RepID=A0A1S2XCI0_CICAR|nr:uncharacterized protein LOC101489986 [Cicer arietinum]